MSGPVLVIELAEAVPDTVLQQLRRFLLSLSTRFEEQRPGEYDISVLGERLGITGGYAAGESRPFLVSLMGPAIGDEEIFAAEHADEPDLKPLIGFDPTHAVDVIAMCDSPIDHTVTALLTAAIMDVIGGVANVELREDQMPIVAGLPGVVGRVTKPWEAAFGTAEFLRAWASQRGFRLVK